MAPGPAGRSSPPAHVLAVGESLIAQGNAITQGNKCVIVSAEDPVTVLHMIRLFQSVQLVSDLLKVLPQHICRV